MKEAAAAVLVRHDVDRPARASSASSESGSLELILSLDKTKLDVRKECWYLIDATWLNQWAQFVDIERQDRLQKEREEKAKQKEERRRLRQQRWEEADISDDEGSEGFSSSDEEEDEDDGC